MDALMEQNTSYFRTANYNLRVCVWISWHLRQRWAYVITTILIKCVKVGKPHIQNKNNSTYSRKATALVSRRVTHVAGWISEVLSQRFTFPSQTITYVYRLADAHQICTLNFCKWLYIFFFTGLAALYRHWRFLVPGSNPAQSKQVNHSSHISLVHAVSTHWCGNNATNKDTTDYHSKKNTFVV
jgi:hypothetical protein